MNTGLKTALFGVVRRRRFFKGLKNSMWTALLVALGLGLNIPLSSFANVPAESTLQEEITTTSSAQLRRGRTYLSTERLRLEGRLGVGTQYLDNETDQGTNANFGAGIKMSFDFVESLRLDSQFQVNFSNERWQSRLDDARFSDGFRVKEAAVKFSPIWEIELGLGAINQKSFIDMPLLISNKPFPGGYGLLRLGNEQNHVSIQAQRAVPYSQSFDSDRQEKEPMPYYDSYGVKARLEPNPHITFEPFLQRYKYTDLPSSVAYVGATKGNTVPDATPTSAEFAFDFAGFATGLNLEIKPNDFIALGVCYSQIQNEEAPQAYNTGEMGCVKTPVTIGSAKIIPTYGIYYNESDTSPAIYNSAELGNNNRQGDYYKLEVEFPRWNFKVEAFYTLAAEINDNINQSDQEYFYISLETLYVEF